MTSPQQRRPSAPTPYHKPSTSFSTISSAASATSVGTSRSGGSRLLFGEIDLTSDRSSETVASVCSLVLSDSSTFLKFWLTDRCREQLISCLPKPDLANLRLVCHDFGARAAPTLFENLSVTFKSSTFTRPARMAALDRVGFHVKHLTFNMPHTPETFLPPLIHPETGEELNFSYTPQTEIPGSKYGDDDTTALLIHQYPPLFHAATNVPVFIRAFSCFANLTHLEISCPGSNASVDSRRSIVDYALISLRMAIERSHFNALDNLTLSPIHAAGLLSLSPRTGCGASPSSAKRWSSIKHLSISTPTPRPPPNQRHNPQDDPSRLLASYLSTFQPNLLTLQLAWLGAKGPLPLSPSTSPRTPRNKQSHHHLRTAATHETYLHFPQITTLQIKNAHAKSSHVRALAMNHARTLQTLELTDVELTEGSWKEAFAPLTNHSDSSSSKANDRSPPRKKRTPPELVEMSDIPIMFAPPATPAQSPSQARSVHPAERQRVRKVLVQADRDKPLPVPSPTLLKDESRRAGKSVTKEKKLGLLGRVARGVKRTFGG